MTKYKYKLELKGCYNNVRNLYFVNIFMKRQTLKALFSESSLRRQVNWQKEITMLGFGDYRKIQFNKYLKQKSSTE